MCSRFFLKQQDYREMLARLGIAAPAEFITRYNITPGTAIPVVRPLAQSDGLESVALSWGLVPSWVQRPSATSRHINARSETVASKPSFRDAFRSRRCLIPVSGFIEWKRVGPQRIPWLFRHWDERPFFIAGLWESHTAATGENIETCALLTTAPNEVMQPIHDRMPVVLAPDQYVTWLQTTTTPPAALLTPSPAEWWRADRISSRINSVRHDDPACLAPAGDADLIETTDELRLSS